MNKSTNEQDARENTRTAIDDIAIEGQELSEENLRLVSGGMRPGGGSSGSCTEPGMCDDE